MPTLDAARADFHHRLAKALSEALAWPTIPKPLVLVTAPGGIGKSHMTAQLLSGHRVTWFGERNRLLPQLDGFLSGTLPGVQRLPGPIPPGPTTIEKQIAREDPGACSELDARVRPLMQANLGRYIESMACRMCPALKSCTYQNWKPSKDWLFAPHVWLGLAVDHTDMFRGRDVVVIDESPFGEVLDGVSLAAWEMDLLVTKLRELPDATVATKAFIAIFEQALAILRSPPKGRARVELRQLVADLGFQFLADLRPRLNLLPERQRKAGYDVVDPNGVATVVKQLTGVESGVRGKLSALADALSADTAARPTCVLVLPADKTKAGIAAGHFKPLPVPDHLPLVVLDATGDPARYWCGLLPTPLTREGQAAGGRPILTVGAKLEMASRIYQTVDARYPASTLGAADSPSTDRLMTIVDRYKADHPERRIGLVVKKQLFKENREFRARVQQTIPSEADVKFFWSLRGDNSLQDYDAIFIIGAPELDALQVEASVRAYMSRLDPFPEEQPYDYKPTVRDVGLITGMNLSDAHGRRVNPVERSYVGTEQFIAWRLSHQDEYVQAILRGRPYDPERPKDIFFLSSAYLGVLPVTYISEAELLGEDLLVLAKKKLEEWRRAGNDGRVTQRDLAAMLGMHESVISRARKKDPSVWIELLAGEDRPRGP
jgi:hypothetical protein